VDQREARKQACRQYDKLRTDFSAIMFRHDPVGINYDVNPDEYDLEAERIVPQLRTLATEKELLYVVRNVVREMFGSISGTPEQYEAMTHDLWQRWQQERSIISDE